VATGAQIQELVNTVYILAADRYTDTVDGDTSDRVPVDQPLIAAALEEFRVELKARVGFRAGDNGSGQREKRRVQCYQRSNHAPS
jgi:hypothetical protein